MISFTQQALNKGFDPEKPLVFLDLDGTCSSENFIRKLASQNLHKDGTIYKLDPDAIKFLNEIADWNFVISSTWRKFKTLEKLNEIFQSLGFKGKLLDITPDFGGECGSLRGNEIREWLYANTSDGQTKRYVILDDDSDVLLWQKDNFIQIDPYWGISPTNIWAAKKIVGEYI